MKKVTLTKFLILALGLTSMLAVQAPKKPIDGPNRYAKGIDGPNRKIAKVIDGPNRRLGGDFRIS